MKNDPLANNGSSEADGAAAGDFSPRIGSPAFRQTPEAAARTDDYYAARRALESVQKERERQENKWGQQNHDPFTYLAILTEEVGELSQAALHTKFGGDKAAGLMEEAVQVAAVALAIVECLERRKWRWPVNAEPSNPHQERQSDAK